LAPAPKYFRTAAWDTKTPMAPAMKNAGTRHVRTCSLAYSWSIMKASSPACLTFSSEKGT